MKSTLILTSALCGLGLAAHAQNQKVNVISWGGAYEKSQVAAYNAPFAEKTGIKVNMSAADNPATPLKAQIEARNITGDVFDIEVSDAIRLCDEGALVQIDPASLPAAPEGVDRAFAKLDTIKNDVVWWEAGAQPVQLLATGYNGRFFDAMVGEGKPFEIIWDGQYMDMFAIPVGSPNPKAALEYLKFATDTQRLADQAKYIAYGPARKGSAALAGLYQDGKTEMAPYMPTAEDHMKTAVMDDPVWWADHDAELAERFNAWLAGT